MKKLFLSTVLLVLTTVMSFSQTQIDLSNLTQDIDLGQNCSSSQTPQQFITTGDVNLNGYEIDLRNAILIITGNLNGPGEIDGCGQSELCVQGVVQNNPEIDDVNTCNTLSINTITTKNLNVPLLVYNSSISFLILEIDILSNSLFLINLPVKSYTIIKSTPGILIVWVFWL